MQRIINEINKKLDTINFDKLWRGFVRYDYALYDDKKVYLNDEIFPADSRFLGNTSIEYNGKYIAIWKLEQNINIDELTACIVHEMFHAHQYTCKQKIYCDNIRGLK